MFNLDALLRFINVNGDEIIQKSEVEDFVAKQQTPSIFSNYFNSMSGDVDNDTFLNDMHNIMQRAKAENNQEPELNFVDREDAARFQKLCEEQESYEKSGANMKRDENGYFPYGVNQKPLKMVNSLGEIPIGSHENIRDARGCDITQLNLTQEQLLNLTIDKTTVMTPEQKAILETYMEAAKNPGLGIRQLHEQGFTGKGVKMAIIDQPLGMHEEYKDNIIGEVHDINSEELGEMEASLHGAAVTSIAAGKNTGVAPDVGVVYYSAINASKDPEDIKVYKEKLQKVMNDYRDTPDIVDIVQKELKAVEKKGDCITNMPYVEAINKILDENEKLPENERVSVVSISWGFNKQAPGYEELLQAIQRAKEEGVFIVSTRMREHYGFYTNGANRSPVGDIDSSECYEAGAWWKSKPEDALDYITVNGADKDKLLLFPMDHRTVADFKDSTSYRYEGNDGGMSWSTPWVAGMYVLAKQADPSITPEKFWQYALETSSECRNNDSGNYVGRLINPQGLIQKIQENKGLD